MKKICFVLTVSTGINYGSIFAGPSVRNNDEVKNFFSKFYDVSINYFDNKDLVDYLVVSDPFVPFENENNLPIIKVPARLFMTKNYNEIKICIDNYFTDSKS